MDEKFLNQALDTMVAFGYLFLFAHVYHYCLPYFQSIGWWGVVPSYLMMFLTQMGLFHTPMLAKLLALGLVLLGSFGSKGKPNEKAHPEYAMILLLGFVALYFCTPQVAGLFTGSFNPVYIFTSLFSLIAITFCVSYIARAFAPDLREDLFNVDNQSFPQEERLMKNKYSVNLPTKYYYRGKYRNGWINVVNPFRATMVLGTPGSGKSYAVINNFIKQHIEKGFSMYVYDFKFPDLSKIAFNHYMQHLDAYKDAKIKFCTINFDDAERSHRCNPIHPRLMEDYIDAKETANVILVNLNRSWTQKQGEFFVESPKVLFSSIIWFLKLYKNGKYCDLPHALELLSIDYRQTLPILFSYVDLENDLAPFLNAAEAGAQEQLQGQIASTQLSLANITSKKIYWALSGDDFTLDLNNPDDSKILCVGNNPDNQTVYSAVLALFNSRIMKLINKKGKRPCSVIIDELPTIYFKGIDNLIATARQNKVSICLGFQDMTQLVRDYGKEQADAINNTIGNVFCGQVLGQTAKYMSDRFGKILQQSESLNINRTDTTSSLSTRFDTMIPESVISNLSQGEMVGAVADNRGEVIPQNIFHCEIVIDAKKVDAETANYKDIPILTDFGTKGLPPAEAKLKVSKMINDNFLRIKKEARQIVEDELKRIRNPYDKRGSVVRSRDIFYAINGRISAKDRLMYEQQYNPFNDTIEEEEEN